MVVTPEEMAVTAEEAIRAGRAVLEAILKEKPIRIPEEEKRKIVEELRKVTSPERVGDKPHILAYYRGSSFGVGSKLMGFRLPDMVVYPESTEEVREILKIASKYRVPVTVVCRQSSSVLANKAFKGGIVLDLKSMNRIHKIDTEHSYVVIEPGVTIAQLMEEIRPKGYTVPKGSYYSSFSVVSTLVAWAGMHNFTNRIWDQVIGLEMVMPDGTILYTGTMVYGDCELWTEVQQSFNHLKNLFAPQYATIGVVTKAAIRIWPLLEETALPIFGFDEFESAFRWTQAIAKSSMVDQTMVWNWVTVGRIEYARTGRFLDYMEARMKYNQDETPKELNLFNCFAWAQMRGYKEEIRGAVETTKRLARQYGGTYLPEEELQEKLPNMWRYFSKQFKEFKFEESEDLFSVETIDFTTQFVGPVEEIIKMYKGLTKKFKELKYKNWNYYTRMFHSGQGPWFRFFPACEGTTREEIEESLRIRDEITKHVLANYKVTIMKNDFILNDPENPENVMGRAKPIRRLMSAVQREFDPENIMTPAMKKYTLL